MDGRRSGAIIDSVVAAYVDSLYVNKNADLEQLRDLAEKNHVPVILKDAESLLLMILKLKQPSRILEIGTAVGYSACCFADACDCTVTTLEADAGMHEAAISNIKNLGFEDRITTMFGDARDSLKKLAETDAKPFDLVFIDAAKSHYREFWDLAYPLCSDNAMIICDNVLMKGMTASDEFDTKRRYKTSIKRMRDFLEYINTQDNIDTSVLPVGDGVSISVINK